MQWFPGHMAKAQRKLARYLDSAELILIAADARAPRTSFSKPRGVKAKPFAVVFTKTDLADPKKTTLWKNWFRDQKILVYDSQPSSILSFAQQVNKPLHVVIMGLPNIGKSTLINRLVHRKKARTGALPGVTRGPQWVKVHQNFYLLDTPGVFFPQDLSLESAWRLVSIGTIPEKIFQTQSIELSEKLVRYAKETYGLFSNEPDHFISFLEAFGKRRGLLHKKGEIDLDRAACALVSDFQKGKWGRITLEEPN